MERGKDMGKALVLAEKPSVAKELARVLKCHQNHNGYLEGAHYVVTWALGHLVTLADPENYDGKYKVWRLEDLPMLPEQMELTVIKGSHKQYGIIRGLLHRKDITSLIIATDAGREGELVARWIVAKAGFNKPIKRLWISSHTEKAILAGFQNLKDAKETEALFVSAQCRAEADWYVGLNITRALTCKHNAQLSAGRVQTPTLAMILGREQEIAAFVPQPYWQVSAQADGFILHWYDTASGQMKTFHREVAEKIIQETRGSKAEVLEIVREAKIDLPPQAYDLTELQRDANQQLGYTAKKTLSVIQRLYEIHKVVTYPRTDSKYISQDMVDTLQDRLKSIAVGPYAPMVAALNRNQLNVSKRFVDNAKVTDHHAILPTDETVDFSAMHSEERKLYDLIVRRFIAVLSPNFLYEQTRVKVRINGHMFCAKGKIIQSMGWKGVHGGTAQNHAIEGEEQDQSLPKLSHGQQLMVKNFKLISGKTKPPARYTEATLLWDMEHAGKSVQDKSLKETLENTSGLGTPATRADIIEKLFDAFYMERKGQEIVPTDKGKQLIALVPPDLKSAVLTAQWEQKLADIGKGKILPSSFMKEIRAYASQLVAQVVVQNESYRHNSLSREKCPDCGKYLLDIAGKKGKRLLCPDRGCGFSKGVSRISNARCPQCHKKMEVRGEAENKQFFCTCGYREKLSDFKARKGSKVNKRELQHFMMEKNEDVVINSALADALAAALSKRKH